MIHARPCIQRIGGDGEIDGGQTTLSSRHKGCSHVLRVAKRGIQVRLQQLLQRLLFVFTLVNLDKELRTLQKGIQVRVVKQETHDLHAEDRRGYMHSVDD